MATFDAALELSRPPISVTSGEVEAPKVRANESLGWPWQTPIDSLPFGLRHLVIALDTPGDHPTWVAILAAVVVTGSATISILTWDRSDSVYFHRSAEPVPTRTAVLVNKVANIQDGRISGSTNKRP